MAENPLCPLCAGAGRRYLSTKDWNRRTSDQVFTYFRCIGCGCVFLSEVPSELEKYYPANYHSFPKDPEELLRVSRADEGYKIELVRRFKTGGRLVEIGPSSGGFLLQAARAGFEVEAVEMGREASRYISDVLRLPVVHAGDEVGALERMAPADVVALWHVIEHTRDPKRLIHAAAEKLKEGGVLILSAPNPDALQFKVLGRRWVHLDAPRHVALLPMAAVIAEAGRCGLALKLKTTRDAGSIYWNGFGWRRSLGDMAPQGLKRAAASLGRAVTRALSFIESSEGRGSAYTLVFERGKCL